MNRCVRPYQDLSYWRRHAPPFFAPHRPRNISESASTIMALLYIKQKEISSSNSLAQWHNTRPKQRGAAVRTMGNVDISNTPRFHILPEPMSQSSKNMLPYCTFCDWTTPAKKVLRQDQYCITSVKFWDAHIAPYILWFIIKVYVAVAPLDRISAANAAMVMASWRRIPWF